MAAIHDPMHSDVPVGSVAQSLTDPNATTGGDGAPTITIAPFMSVGRYVLSDEIARGGMGIVYMAIDTVLGREVAVKVLHDKYAPASGTCRRFADEARIAAQLQHPGIPPVHDLGTLPDGRPFLAMKLIKGRTLDELLKDRVDPSVDRGRFVGVFEQICHALAYAHAHSVIHRDLKPGNVMVGSFGEVQVMDWGLAKVLGSIPTSTDDAAVTTGGTEVRTSRDSDGEFTQVGSVLGTPAFMPPEQAIGAVDQIDARSDVFGLGGIFCAILTGRPPFVADSAESTRQLAAKGRIAEAFARLDACGAEPDLLALCKRCLASEKDDRPADANEVAKAVVGLRAAADERARQAALDRVRVEGEKAAAQMVSAEQKKRRRAQFNLASAIGVLLLAGGAVATWLAIRAVSAEARARQEATHVAAARAHTRAALDEVSSEAIETLLTQQRELTDRHKAFLRRTLELYAEFAADPGIDVETRAGVARAFHRMGNIREKLGELAEARAAAERAVEGLAALAAEFPDVPAYQADLAQANSDLGMVLYRLGDRAGAEQRFGASVGLLENLHAAHPGDAKYQGNLATALSQLANRLADRTEQKDAEAGYRRAIQLLESLPSGAAGREPRARLASARYNLAYLLEEMDRDDEAETEYGQAIAVGEKLVKEFPQEHDSARRLSSSLINLSKLLANKKSWVAAEDMHRRGLEIQDQLARDYPAIPEYRKYLGRTLDSFARLVRDRGRPDDARPYYYRAVEVKELLARQYPNFPEYRRDLGSTYNNFAYFENQQGRVADAEAGYRKALVVQEPLVRDHPTIPEYRVEMSRSYGNLGSMLQKRKAYSEAERAFRQALEQHELMVKRFPNDTEHLMRQGGEEGNIAMLLSERGEKSGSLKWFDSALDHLRTALGVMKRPSPLGLEWLMETTIALADTQEALGQKDAALPALDAALKLVPSRQDDPAATRQVLALRIRACQLRGDAAGCRDAVRTLEGLMSADWESLYELSKSTARLSATVRAADPSPAGAKQAEADADRAMDWLKKAAGTGRPNNASVDTDAAFKSLRGREDFERLVADLKKKQVTNPELAPSPREIKP